MVFALPGKPSISVLPLDNLSKSIERSLAGATALLQKAIALDDSTAEAYGLLGFVFSHKRQHERALSQAEKAIELSPSSSASHFRLAKILNFSDRNNEAILEYKIAIRLNPIPPSIYFWSLGLAYAETGQYEEGITWCEKAIDREPDSLWARIMLTAVYGWSGRDEEARTEAAEVLRINPNFSLERFAVRASPKLVATLRRAGLK